MQNSRIHELKAQLQQVRKQSLEASRLGDFMKCAKLTLEAANINRAIAQAEVESVSKGHR